MSRKRQLSCCITFLLLSSAMVVNGQVSVRLTRAKGSQESCGPSRIVAQGVVGEGSTKEPVTVLLEELQLPGEAKLSLSAGEWRITLESERCWASSRIVNAPGQLELPVWPVVRLLAELIPPVGMPVPEEALLTFAPTFRLHRDEVPAEPSGTVSCKMSGQIAVCPVPALETLDLRVSAKGFGAVYRWERHFQEGKTASLGKLPLVAGGSLTGWVVAEEDSSLDPDSISVAVLPAGTVTESRNMADFLRLADAVPVKVQPTGFFQVGGLAQGHYTLLVVGPDIADVNIGVEIVEGRESALREPVVLTRPRKVTFVISPPVGLDGESWRMRLDRQDAYRSEFRTIFNRPVPVDGVLDATGLTPGPHIVIVSDSGGHQMAAKQIVIDEATDLVSIEIETVPVEGVLTLGDEPLAGTIWFGGRFGAQRVEVATDEEGRYETLLPRSGHWRVEVHAEIPFVRRKIDRMEVPKPKEGKPARVDLHLPATRLFGTVNEASGTPPQKTTIFYVLPSNFSEILSVRVDPATGEFDLRGLPPGMAKVRADTATARSRAVYVQLLEDGEVEVHLTLLPLEKLKGRVVDDGGLPVPGASVELSPWEEMGLPPRHASADAEGRFEVDVAQGTSDAIVQVSSPGRTLLVARVMVSTDRELVVQLPARGGTLILDLPQKTRGYSADHWYMVTRDGVPIPVGALESWAAINPVADTEAGLAAASVAPGNYRACVIRTDEYLPWLLGKVSGNCASWILPTFGELRLNLND